MYIAQLVFVIFKRWNNLLVSIGSLVISKNGRDKDKYFLVVKIEDDYVYLW